MANCRSCGAEIIWVKTLKGKRMPLDPLPSPEGNLGVRDDGVVVSSAGFPPEQRRISHFATCPNANAHRRS